MTCSRDLIEAYLDQELDPGLSASLEEHLASCQACSETYSRLLAQKTAIRKSAPYYMAPSHLERSVRDALRQAAAGEPRAAAVNPAWRWLAIAATLLLAISFAWNLRPRSGTAESELVAQNVLSDHIRSLIGTHLLDVLSTDRHTVKPWFNGKLDFSPEVKDLAVQGFPLLGGRLDYLRDRPVAALVYGRRQHVINLFTWPGDSGSVAESRFARNGYTAIHWSHGPMTFWAVSDIAPAELEQFRNLYQQVP